MSCLNELPRNLGSSNRRRTGGASRLSKKLIILAGPNGAGKTTFARTFLPEEAHCPRFINADLIAAGLSPFAPEAAAIKAGRLMLEEIDEAVAHGESFAFETTLSGIGYRQRIRLWRRFGYHVSLFFCAFPTRRPPSTAWRRACGRAGTIFPKM